MGISNVSNLCSFSEMRTSQMDGIFYPSGDATELLEYNIFSKKALREAKKNKYCLDFFQFLRK